MADGGDPAVPQLLGAKASARIVHPRHRQGRGGRPGVRASRLLPARGGRHVLLRQDAGQARPHPAGCRRAQRHLQARSARSRRRRVRGTLQEHDAAVACGLPDCRGSAAAVHPGVDRRVRRDPVRVRPKVGRGDELRLPLRRHQVLQPGIPHLPGIRRPGPQLRQRVLQRPALPLRLPHLRRVGRGPLRPGLGPQALGAGPAAGPQHRESLRGGHQLPATPPQGLVPGQLVGQRGSAAALPERQEPGILQRGHRGVRGRGAVRPGHGEGVGEEGRRAEAGSREGGEERRQAAGRDGDQVGAAVLAHQQVGRVLEGVPRRLQPQRDRHRLELHGPVRDVVWQRGVPAVRHPAAAAHPHFGAARQPAVDERDVLPVLQRVQQGLHVHAERLVLLGAGGPGHGRPRWHRAGERGRAPRGGIRERGRQRPLQVQHALVHRHETGGGGPHRHDQVRRPRTGRAASCPLLRVDRLLPSIDVHRRRPGQRRWQVHMPGAHRVADRQHEEVAVGGMRCHR
mmetsp:Transcript_15678/g.43954  ORF Transcript_15678/g.43954 Transcript_15678/m.43954 type:complete len:512 (-) Transcript_15678:71-1606(-)